MGGWGLPAATAAFWGGLLAWTVRPSLLRPLPVWAWFVVGTAALAAALIAAPGVRRSDPLAPAGLVRGEPQTRAVLDPRGRPVGSAVLVLVGVAVLGAAWAGLADIRRLSSYLGRLGPGTVALSGTLREDVRPTALGWRAIIDVTRVTIVAGRAEVVVRETVWVSGDDEAPLTAARGDLVAITGSPEVPDDVAFADALRRRGIAVAVRARFATRLGPAPSPFIRATQIVRAAVGGSIERVFGSREAGLLLGLALGDASRLDAATERDFRATGLTHLLVVSGGNVAMVLAPVLAVAAALRLARVGQAIVGVTAVVFFVILTGAEPSVMRAGAMAVTALLGVMLGRPRSTAAVLAAAVWVLLVLDPWLVHAVGFQLSVAATGGLVALAAPLTERFARLVPAPLAAAVGTTLAAQVAVSPVLLFHFGDVPLITLVANVVAAPAVAPALLAGVAAAAIGLVAEPAGAAVAAVAQLPMRWLALVADVLGRAPVAHVTSRGGLAVLAVGGAIVVAMTVALRTGWRPPRAMFVAATLALPVLVWSSAVSKGAPSGLTVRFFDVGQGDAALITSPGGTAVLVDGGPDEEQVATELAALGITRLDVVVASHPHADHVIGLPAVLARVQVSVLLQPGCPDDSPLQADLDRAVADEGIAVQHPRAGAVYTVGDIRIDVVSPDRCWSGTESDTNNDALILRVSLGDDVVLIASESEEPAQELLLEMGVDLRADVLKVPHHGAATSVPAFFDAVAAPVAVVSVGENTYGHPVPSTLDALVASGSTVWRTDLRGTVTVTFDRGSPTVTGAS